MRRQRWMWQGCRWQHRPPHLPFPLRFFLLAPTARPAEPCAPKTPCRRRRRCRRQWKPSARSQGWSSCKPWRSRWSPSRHSARSWPPPRTATSSTPTTLKSTIAAASLGKVDFWKKRRDALSILSHVRCLLPLDCKDIRVAHLGHSSVQHGWVIAGQLV